MEGNTRPFTCYQEKEILDFLQNIGLKQSERYAQFLIPMVLHRTLKSTQVSSALEKILRLLGFTNLFGSPVIAKIH